MDYKEFSGKVKAKYPQYSDMDDEELAQKMVAKFPQQYSDVTFKDAVGESDQDAKPSDPKMRELAINMAKFIFADGKAKAPAALSAAMSGAVAGGAPDIRPLARGVTGVPESEGASFEEEAKNLAGNIAPHLLAQAGIAAATGGMSIPAQGAGLLAKGAALAGPALARAAASGAITGGQKAIRGGSTEGVGAEAGKSALASLSVEGLFGAAGQAFKLSKPGLVRLGSQLIKSTSAVPEKYGKAVLENPSILTEAPSLKVASAMYRRAVNGMKGAREFLESKTGSIVMDPGDAIKLLEDTVPKIGTATPPSLQEALAARQSAANLLEMAKFGDPRMRASKGALIAAKDQLDDILEAGLPGFKKTTKTYFEANAREAFQSILPQNKNLSSNALRSLGALSVMSAGALMKAPFVLAGAAAFSPKATGMMIRGGKSVGDLMASQATQFAARVGAIKAVEGRTP